MERYKICKDDFFFIFGAGILGRRICDNLLNAGFRVCGFFDNSVFLEPVYRDLPIFSFQKMQDWPPNYREGIVVISLANPFDHAAIKDTLLANGFSRIICKRDIHKHEGDYKVNALYDTISSFYDGLHADMIVGAEFELWNEQSSGLFDAGILGRQEGYVTAYVPIELIQAVGKPVVMNTQVIRLFECFQGKDNNGVQLFWEYVCATQSNLPKNDIECEKNRIISGRLKVYLNMVQALSIGAGFFLRHPVVVEKRGNVFEIKDGMHRSLFLYVHGFRLVPCMIPEGQYDEWLGTVPQITCTRSLSTPILHPFYYLERSVSENAYETRMDAILRYFADQDTNELTVFDFGRNDGWFARNLCRAGLSVSYLADKSDQEFILTINNIEQTEIEMLLELPNDRTFDIVISLDLISSYSTESNQIEQLLQLSSRYVIIEMEQLSSLDEWNISYKILRKSINPDIPFKNMYLVVFEINNSEYGS